MMANECPVLPRLEPLPPSSAEASWVGHEWSATPAVVRDKRILLVDDQEPFRAFLRMMLELDGHQVTEASNGAEALNSFTLGEFDLVITDFEMPVMEGNELAVSLKLLAPSLPILMITGSEKARCDVENPVDALLNKPLTVSDLRGALGMLLSAAPERKGATRSLVRVSVPAIVAG